MAKSWESGGELICIPKVGIEAFVQRSLGILRKVGLGSGPSADTGHWQQRDKCDWVSALMELTAQAR